MATESKYVRRMRKVISEIITDFEIERTKGAHYKVNIEGPLGKRSVIVSASPSDFREERNMVRDLNRAMVLAGLHEPANSQPKPKE